MKKPSRFLRILGAASLMLSLLVGAFGTASVAAQDDADDGGLPFPVAGESGVFFPWVANDDESTGLGPADTSITIQNLGDDDALMAAYVGAGSGDLSGENNWELIGPFSLEPHASKTFSAAQLGIAEGEGAPVAVAGFSLTGEVIDGGIADYNQDGDMADYETIAGDEFLSGANSWTNTDPVETVTWEEGDCLVVDVDGESLNVYPAGHAPVVGGTAPEQPGANLDDDPDNCVATESEAAVDAVVVAPLAGVAKQAVDGENLPYTTDADTAVSGYNGLAGWDLIEVGNLDAPFNGWYLPIVQTNGGPGGTWNSIIRVANFGDSFGGELVGAAGVTVTIYPADNGEGELGESQVISQTLNAGDTLNIDLSDYVPEGFVGSAHIAADAPIFAMVDRVKVGYNQWITNTASNALVSAVFNEPSVADKFVLFAPDVRKDFFGWNTGINVANLADFDNTVTIQYYGPDGGVATQTAELHENGMTYFYDPSQAPQDNSSQDPETDLNAEEIGAAIIIADAPVAVAVDATKYPESTTEVDANVYQALSYSATQNLFEDQAVPLVQKGNPDTGMGATSGIQLFNPNDQTALASIYWHDSTGDLVGNETTVAVSPNSMTFVYTMTDANLSQGFVGSADVFSDTPISVISTMVDYQVEFDGSAVWNGYNPGGAYRDLLPQPEPEAPEANATLDVVTLLSPVQEPVLEPGNATPPTIPGPNQTQLQQAEGNAPAHDVLVQVHELIEDAQVGPDIACAGEVIDSGTTDENGHVAFELPAGSYCVDADPNNDGVFSSMIVTVSESDAPSDTDATIIEVALPGIADFDPPAGYEVPTEEELEDTEIPLPGGMIGYTFLAPVEGPGVSCSYLGSEFSFTDPDFFESVIVAALVPDGDGLGDPQLELMSGIENLIENPPDDPAEVEVDLELASLAPGYYCSLGILVDFELGLGASELPGTAITPESFYIASNDPATDIDATLSDGPVVDFDAPAGIEPLNPNVPLVGLSFLIPATGPGLTCSPEPLITGGIESLPPGSVFGYLSLDADGLGDPQLEFRPYPLLAGSQDPEIDVNFNLIVTPGFYCGYGVVTSAGSLMTLESFEVTEQDPPTDVDATLVPPVEPQGLAAGGASEADLQAQIEDALQQAPDLWQVLFEQLFGN